MEKDEKQKEEDVQDDDMDMEEPGQMKQWLQDNMRIIVSVIIVVAIAGGIYSYSKRTEAPTNQPSETPVLEEINQGVSTQENTTPAPAEKTAPTGQQKATEVQKPAVASQETDNSFVETASKGDGMTRLARRALANYLEKNPDSALTAEHKIYIEDYLRKNVAKKGVRIGTTVEFSKNLIQNAVSKSKTLNERQLQNLHKYAVRVPSLS